MSGEGGENLSPTRVHALRDDAIGSDDAVAIAKRIADGEISALEAVDAAIQRLEVVDPLLHAVACERFEEARTDSGDLGSGPFAGVPSLIKDNTELAGLPTRHGSRAVPSRIADRHEPFTRQFLSSGLIPIAKTRLPEFGLTATTEFSIDEAARNPWNTDHSCGGSSGGSAALVAAGVVPIAHANDGGGSIRIPAACCGLVGLKPTRDRLRGPLGSDRLPVNIVVNGVVSRSVRDTAKFCMAAEQHWHNPGLPRLGKIDRAGQGPLRIGMIAECPDGTPPHADCVAAVERAGQICELLGHEVEIVRSPTDEQMASDFLLYWAMLAASLKTFGKRMFGAGFDVDELEPLTAHLARHCHRNLHRLPFAIRRLKKFQADYAALFKNHDVLVSPTLASPPPPIGHLCLSLPWETARDRLNEYAVFTPPQNVSGAPAMTLPLGQSSEGLPVGVQFAAPYGADRRLLELAFAIEEAAPWRHVWG